MQLSNQHVISVPIQQVWDALNNTEILQACIPGCESLTSTGDHTYEVIVMAAVGPVKARFKGKLALQDLTPPSSYKIKFEGQGGAAGHGKGHADVTLASTAVDETVLHYSANATVGGKIAQIGQRLVDMAAQRMAAEFFSSFEAHLRSAYPAGNPGAVQSHAEPAIQANIMHRIVAWLRRIFR